MQAPPATNVAEPQAWEQGLTYCALALLMNWFVPRRFLADRPRSLGKGRPNSACPYSLLWQHKTVGHQGAGSISSFGPTLGPPKWVTAVDARPDERSSGRMGRHFRGCSLTPSGSPNQLPGDASDCSLARARFVLRGGSKGFQK